LNAGAGKAADTSEAGQAKHLPGDRISYVMHPSFHASGAAGRYRDFNPGQISEATPVNTFSLDECDPAVSAGSHRKLSLREAFLHLNYRRWMTSRVVAETTAPSTAAPQRRLHRLEREADEIRNWIIEQNSSLVTIVASRFLQRGVTLDELRSEANMILLRAIDRFDVQRGVLFSTYASAAINRHLQRWLGNQARSKPQQESLQVVEAEPASPQPPSATHDLAREATIRDAIQSLPRLLQQIVKLRFGLDNLRKPLSFRATAERLGISRERCRRLCAKALERLKAHTALRHFEPSN